MPRPLPASLTPLVGRTEEAAAIAALFEEGGRLVTLTGPGGIGKTRLAIAAAERLAARFPAGLWFVPLAAVDDPDRVLPAVARAVGVSEAGDRPLLPVVASVIPDTPSLIVLDNVEQVTAAAPLLAELLVRCPELRILATGREPLALSGERRLPVPPLPIPDPGDPSSAALDASALRLFADRARAALPDFALTADNRQAVAAICAELDGLPLAIELAAARVSLLSPADILAYFVGSTDGALDLLTRGPRDAPVRHRTLRETIAWSFRLLSPAQQTLFRRLAAFSGGFTLDAAAAIVDVPAPLAIDLLDGVADLVDKNLVNREPVADPEPARFGMLRTIRAFAVDQLAASGDDVAIGARHAAYFARLAAKADDQILGPRQAAWLHRLEQEHDNLRAALEWTVAHDEPALLVRLAGDLARFWRFHWHHSDGNDWLNRAVAAAAAEPSPTARAKALLGAGLLASMGCDYHAAEAWHRQAVAAYGQAGDASGEGRALLHLGEAANGGGDIAEAARSFDRSLDRLGTADAPLRALVLKNLADLALRDQRYAAAAEALGEALRLAAQSDFDWGRAEVLVKAAELSRARGRPAQAIAELDEAIARYRDFGDPIGVAVAGIQLALAAADLRQDHDAVALYAGATASFRRSGLRSPLDKYQPHRAWLDARRDLLGTAAFDAAWNHGAAQPVERFPHIAAEAAGRLAATEATEAPSATPSPALPFGLSQREAEVLRLVAAGLTNAQVADRLFLSPRTINAHLNRIYAKLGVPNRGAASRLASDTGIA